MQWALEGSRIVATMKEKEQEGDRTRDYLIKRVLGRFHYTRLNGHERDCPTMPALVFSL